MLAAGVDEAGRGCVFGPVCAAAVIWNPECTTDYIKDSKKLSEKRRKIAYEYIIDNAIDYSIGFASAQEIDSMNILHATQLAMHRALDGLSLEVDQIDVDGNYFKPYMCTPHQCVIGGDRVLAHISAASILAKVSRDELVARTVQENPALRVYKLESHKGYCTRAHCEALQTHGRSAEHRRSFRLPFEKSDYYNNGQAM